MLDRGKSACLDKDPSLYSIVNSELERLDSKLCKITAQVGYVMGFLLKLIMSHPVLTSFPD